MFLTLVFFHGDSFRSRVEIILHLQVSTRQMCSFGNTLLYVSSILTLRTNYKTSKSGICLKKACCLNRKIARNSR
nr:MAG TPA: hypothetical protein [Caudoviricetes sp.]